MYGLSAPTARLWASAKACWKRVVNLSMRIDKFTTRFQQAFADAQSLAVGADNPYIEPQHLLTALLNQDDGGTASLLSRAGVNVAGLRASLKQALDRLPRVEGT